MYHNRCDATSMMMERRRYEYTELNSSNSADYVTLQLNLERTKINFDPKFICVHFSV